jgi:hypothetical protein
MTSQSGPAAAAWDAEYAAGRYAAEQPGANSLTWRSCSSGHAGEETQLGPGQLRLNIQEIYC